MYRNPALGQGLSDIARAITGDPFKKAQSEAYIAQAARQRAAANLDFQTQEYRDKTVNAGLADDLLGVLTYGLGAGGDQARFAPTIANAIAARPGTSFSEADLGRFQVGAGVQGAGDTFEGQRRDNDASMARQRVSSGATVQAARIAQQGAMERQMAELVEAVGEDGVARLIAARDAGGMGAVITKPEAQGSLINQAIPDLLAGRPVPREVLEIADAIAKPSSSTPRNYATPDARRGVTLDGVTDAATGQPIPAGSQVFTGALETGDVGGFTSSTQTMLEKDNIAHNDLIAMIDLGIEAAQQNPGAFGLVGGVNRTMQDVQAQAQLLSGQFGQRISQSFPVVAQDLAAAGVDPQFYDPGLNEIQQIAITLAYMDAKAADPGGRVTDQDFRASMRKIGDPNALLSTPQKFVGLLQGLRRQAETRQSTRPGAERRAPTVRLRFNPETGEFE